MLITPYVSKIEGREFLYPFRIESDFSRFSYLFNQFGTDGHLMFEIANYAAIKSQYELNLFNNDYIQEDTGYRSVFDITDFAKMFKYKKENLLRRHQNPAYLNKYPRKNYSGFYTTNIGNAIYRLYTEVLDLEKQIGTSRNNTAIHLIKSINDPDNERGERGKYIIELVWDREFMENINRKYTLLSKDILIAINKGKNKLGIAYAHFSFRANYLASIKRNFWDYDFDEICSIFNINIKEAKDAKIRLTDKVNQLSEKTDLELAIEYFRATDTANHNYGVRIKFLNNGVNSNDEPFKQRAIKDAFLSEFIKNILPFYKSNFTYKYHNNIDFIRFIKSEKYTDEKYKFFKDTYKHMFGENLSDKNDFFLSFFSTPDKFLLKDSMKLK